MEDIKKILQILAEFRPDIDFEKEKRLIDDGTLDSFDIITLVGELNENFSVVIGVEDLRPENFNSVEAIAKLISYLRS